MSTEIAEKLRQSSFRAMIPFHILLDDSLTGRQKALYGIVEQMESSREATPYFSYQWIADLFGITKRGAIALAKTLRDKNYIEHIQQANGKWIWRIVRQPVVCNDQNQDIASDPGGHHPSEAPLHGGGAAALHGGGAAALHPKVPEVKIPESKRERARAREKVSASRYSGHNPHNFPEPMIQAYIDSHIEKHSSPPTLASWMSLQAKISIIAGYGVDPLDVFELCIARSWKALQESYGDVQELIRYRACKPSRFKENASTGLLDVSTGAEPIGLDRLKGLK